ncbi:MAG: ankyrin repeat domain-containing protein [Phycisphaerales bacterium]
MLDAIYSGDPVQSLEALVRSGIPATSSQSELFGPAAWSGQLDVIKFLIAHGLTLQLDHKKLRIMTDAYESRQSTALHIAASKGLVEILETLLTVDGKDFLNTFDSDLSWTPLHHAARDKQEAAARILIDAGADPNAHDESRIGSTPLDVAIENGCAPIVSLLLKAGADPDIPTWTWVSARQRAERARFRQREIWEMIDSIPLTPHMFPDGRWNTSNPPE